MSQQIGGHCGKVLRDVVQAECFPSYRSAFHFLNEADMLVAESETELRDVEGAEDGFNYTSGRGLGRAVAGVSLRGVRDAEGCGRCEASGRGSLEKFLARDHEIKVSRETQHRTRPCKKRKDGSPTV